MERFIPYEKLSKKKQRELDLKKRGSWGGLNPVTRRPKNPKAYDRRKAQSWKKDSGSAPFVFSDPSSFRLGKIIGLPDPGQQLPVDLLRPAQDEMRRPPAGIGLRFHCGPL